MSLSETGGTITLIFNGTDVVWGTPTTAVNTDGTTITGKRLDTELSVGSAIGSAEITDGSVAPVDLDGSGGTDGQALTYNGTDVVWDTPTTAVNTDGTTITGNDLDTDLSVSAIGSAEITDGSVAPVDLDGSGGTDGQALTYNGTDVVWDTPTTAVNTDGDHHRQRADNRLSVGAIGSAEIDDGSVAGDLDGSGGRTGRR